METDFHCRVGALLQRLLPDACVLCGDAGSTGLALCAGCRDELPWVDTARCAQCGVPLPAAEHRCGPCRLRPPPFEGVLAPFRYAPPLDRLIQELKFSGRLAHARLLGSLLAGHATATAPVPDLLLPVPLHPARERLGVRVEQQLVMVESVAVLRIVRTVYPVSVELTRPDVG